MVSTQSVEDQLKKIGYSRGWNRPETEELAAILIEGEEIFECVNGWYEGGFSLLCATNIRVLLIDKKPLNFLNVEDVRFDTINQIDYSHRMFNASICITAGLKSLIFRSYNQQRLRKLISHVQHRMAEIKRLEQQVKDGVSSGYQPSTDQQLRSYLLSQYEQHQSLRRQHDPSLPPLAAENKEDSAVKVQQPQLANNIDPTVTTTGMTLEELYEEGIKEIFGKYQSDAVTNPVKTIVTVDDPLHVASDDNLDTNPLKIAYSKLPMILKRRRSISSV
ncbi:MAG: PH domain-containing protein [Candidatus Saccharimonadales bacterium]